MKRKRCEVWLDHEQAKAISELASEQGRSFSGMIRIMLSGAVGDHTQPQAHTCRSTTGAPPVGDTSAHVGLPPEHHRSTTGGEDRPYIETRAQVPRVTTSHRREVTRERVEQEQHRNYPDSIWEPALPEEDHHTPEQIAEAKALSQRVIAGLNRIARGEAGYDGPRLEWFRFSLKGIDRGLLERDCLRHPDPDRWKRGIKWLTMAGSTKANKLRMHDGAGVLRHSPKHGMPKILCAADNLPGYSLGQGGFATPEDVLAHRLPESWQGMRLGGAPITDAERMKVLIAMKEDAPLVVERLKAAAAREYRARREEHGCRKRARLSLLTEWDMGARYAGVLAPLIAQVADAVDEEAITEQNTPALTLVA